MKKVTLAIDGKPHQVLLCHYPEDYKPILFLLKGGVNAYGSCVEHQNFLPHWDDNDLWKGILQDGEGSLHILLKRLPYMYFDSSFFKDVLKEIIELPS